MSHQMHQSNPLHAPAREEPPATMSNPIGGHSAEGLYCPVSHPSNIAVPTQSSNMAHQQIGKFIPKASERVYKGDTKNIALSSDRSFQTFSTPTTSQSFGSDYQMKAPSSSELNKGVDNETRYGYHNTYQSTQNGNPKQGADAKVPYINAADGAGLATAPQSDNSVGQFSKANSAVTSKRRYYPVQNSSSGKRDFLRQQVSNIAQPVEESRHNFETSNPTTSAHLQNRSVVSSGHNFQPNSSHLDQQEVQQGFKSMTLQQQTHFEDMSVNLSQDRSPFDSNIFNAPKADLPEMFRGVECDASVFRSTLNAIPCNSNLLSKCKVPLGLYIHPYKEIQNLTVITSSAITRCRVCRTYLNPFVTLMSNHKWKCNLCFRVNDLPNEFIYSSNTPINKRPELRNCNIEFIAPSEYMVRPPQPAVYLFMFDVSFTAVSTGYLEAACRILKEELDSLPGDSRTTIGIITFDSSIHYFNLKSSLSQPQMLVVSELDEIFLPTPDDLLVNLQESKELIVSLLDQLPKLFVASRNIHSATGAAIQAGHKLLIATGGRITVFQASLPNIGPGALKMREDPNQRAATAKEISQLTPATDFYKKLALDCCGHQICVDVFVLSTQYADLSSLSCISKYSAGCVYYYCNYHRTNSAISMKYDKELRRYLSRNLGLEAVMRVRCTRGLSIHTFYGNFFVRSTDLLALPNINPDSSFGMQISIEESLNDVRLACFQAALLYTNTKGERRIRVHTLAIPIVTAPDQVFKSLDCQVVVNLLSKMAVDRTLTASIGDAREALMNVIVDAATAYKAHTRSQQNSQIILPSSLKLLPLLVLGLLKHNAFRLGTSTSLDARTFALHQFNTLPIETALLTTYPALYPLHELRENGAIHCNIGIVPTPPLLPLSWEKIYRNGVYLLDAGTVMFVWIGKGVDVQILTDLFDKDNFAKLPDSYMISFPDVKSTLSNLTRNFIAFLRQTRCIYPPLYIIREDSRYKKEFSQYFVNDRTEATMSYFEFLSHIQKQLN